MEILGKLGLILAALGLTLVASEYSFWLWYRCGLTIIPALVIVVLISQASFVAFFYYSEKVRQQLIKWGFGDWITRHFDLEHYYNGQKGGRARKAIYCLVKNSKYPALILAVIWSLPVAAALVRFLKIKYGFAIVFAVNILRLVAYALFFQKIFNF